MAVKKKASSIKFTYKGVKYVLEYDRKSALDAERLYNVSLEDVRSVKISAFDGIFRGAFLKNHSDADEETINEILDGLPRKMEIFEALSLMYYECVKWLFEEPDEGNAISWTVG